MKPAKRTEFRELIARLTEAGVEFIVVGGVAAGALGAARVTLDLDVVYRRTPENLDRVVAALMPLRHWEPYLFLNGGIVGWHDGAVLLSPARHTTF